MSHLFYWEEILGQINLIQKKLQEPGISLNVCVNKMDTTKIFFNRYRDRLVSELINQSKTKSEEIETLIEKRIRKKRKLPGEKEVDVYQTLAQEVKRSLYACHDRLVNKLETRCESMSHLQTVFGGL